MHAAGAAKGHEAQTSAHQGSLQRGAASRRLDTAAAQLNRTAGCHPVLLPCRAASESWNPSLGKDSVQHDRAVSEADGGVLGPSSLEAKAAEAEAPPASPHGPPDGLLAEQLQQQEEQLQLQLEGEAVGESAPVLEQPCAGGAEAGGAGSMQGAHRCDCHAACCPAIQTAGLTLCSHGLVRCTATVHTPKHHTGPAPEPKLLQWALPLAHVVHPGMAAHHHARVDALHGCCRQRCSHNQLC